MWGLMYDCWKIYCLLWKKKTFWFGIIVTAFWFNGCHTLFYLSFMELGSFSLGQWLFWIVVWTPLTIYGLIFNPIGAAYCYFLGAIFRVIKIDGNEEKKNETTKVNCSKTKTGP